MFDWEHRQCIAMRCLGGCLVWLLHLYLPRGECVSCEPEGRVARPWFPSVVNDMYSDNLEDTDIVLREKFNL